MFGTRAGFFVDLFGLLFVLILPAIFIAVMLVRRGKVKAHATIMTTCFFAFMAAVLAFEIDVHTSTEEFTVPLWVLGIHLCFALPSLALWVWQMAKAKQALTNPSPHRMRGRALLVLLTLTVGTGAWLYVETFV